VPAIRLDILTTWLPAIIPGTQKKQKSENHFSLAEIAEYAEKKAKMASGIRGQDSSD